MTDTKTDEQERETPPPRPFTRFLHEQGKGALHAELSEALRDGTAAAQLQRKASTIVLTLKITPNKDGETVSVSGGVKTKFPEPEASSSTYFVGEHGDISRTNPAQTDIDAELRRVSEEDGPARVVGGQS